MVAAGILDEHEPVELIDGELIIVSPQGPTHSSLTVIVRRALERAYGSGFYAQSHSPIDAGPRNLPEPDVAVVRGEPFGFGDRHPGGAELALVVEISLTSQRLDRRKAGVYARAGVGEYWQIDVPKRCLTVFTEPDGAEYRRRATYREDDALTPGGALSAVQVGDLLPPRAPSLDE